MGLSGYNLPKFTPSGTKITFLNLKINQFFMGLFKKKKEIVITGTVCAACGMSFATTDRLMRHMFKAHGKQKTAYEIASCLVGSEMCIRDRSVQPVE